MACGGRTLRESARRGEGDGPDGRVPHGSESEGSGRVGLEKKMGQRGISGPGKRKEKGEGLGLQG